MSQLKSGSMHIDSVPVTKRYIIILSSDDLFVEYYYISPSYQKKYCCIKENFWRLVNAGWVWRG